MKYFCIFNQVKLKKGALVTKFTYMLFAYKYVLAHKHRDKKKIHSFFEAQKSQFSSRCDFLGPAHDCWRTVPY